MANQNDEQNHLQSGMDFYQRGNYLKATKEFKEALSVDPNNAETHNWLGRVALMQQRYEDAEKSFRKASSINSVEPAYRYNIGLALQNLKRYQEAEEEFRRALELNKDCFPAHNGLGALLFDRKRYDDAKAEFQTAIQLNPNDAETHNWLGRVALTQQRYEDAEKSFRKAIELDQKESSAHRDLGSLLTSLGCYDEAETFLKEAVKLDPKDDKSYNELGRFFYTQKKCEEAVFQYRQAVRLNPGNVAAQKGLALSLMAIDRFEEAERQLRPLIESKVRSSVSLKDFWIIHETLSDLFTRLGEKRGDELYYDEAVKEVDRALSGAPGIRKADLYFKRGIIQYHRKQYEVAERDFERCVNLNEKHWAAKRNLERLQTSLSGRRSRTLEIIGKVLAMLGSVQMIVLWALYIIGSIHGKKIIEDTTFAVLAPLLFALTLISFLLPKLTKIKVGGLEADIEKTRPEGLEATMGLRLETGGTPTASSNIILESGKEEIEGAESKAGR